MVHFNIIQDFGLEYCQQRGRGMAAISKKILQNTLNFKNNCYKKFAKIGDGCGMSIELSMSCYT